MVDYAFGMKVSKHGNSGEAHRTNEFDFASGTDAIFTGTPVRINTTTGKVEPAAATESILGVADGVSYTDVKGLFVRDSYLPHQIATTDGKVIVSDDADVEFEIQSNGTVVETDLYKLADIVVGATNGGVEKTGTSNVELNQASVGTGTQLKIVGIVELGANGVVRVKIADKQ